jgi:transglutaminase-like putative cysteine protease
MYSYKGGGSDASVYFWYDVVLNFDRPITGQFTSTRAAGSNQGIYTESIKSDVVINNTLSFTNKVITPQSNYVTYSVNETPLDDYFQNNIFIDIAPGFNQSSVKLAIDYNNMNSSVNFNNAVSANNLSFPINQNSLPYTVLKYLNASPLVESTNSSIKSTAQSITSGCSDYRTAVIKLCQWIEANIKMLNTNPSNQSSTVFSSKVADCDGAAHLLAAFCRSLNIPARIVSGFIIEHGTSYPANKGGTSLITLGSGNGTTLVGHSACEIYVPFLNNWVRCDPAQRTTLFGTQKFVKTATGMESTNHLKSGAYFNYSVTQIPIPSYTSISVTPDVYVGAINSTYQFVKSEIFPGNSNTIDNFGLLCAADPALSVGFYDKVTIQDPPTGTTGISGTVPNNTYTMTPCTPANFYARFATESTPATNSTGFDWSIVLYRANGDEYVYAQQNGIISNTYTPNDYGEGCFWQPTIGTLPAYDWMYDPVGNIYGKVKVTVHISDGDTKYDETTIGVSPRNYIQNVTYSANTTINACAELNLTNVTISGAPTMTFNTNGLGITINGTFEAPLGSTLIINQ